MRRWLLVAVALVAIPSAGIVLKSLLRAHSVLHPARSPIVEALPEGAEAVSFTAADGIVLRGWFLPSKNSAVVVIGHGHGTNRAQLLPEAKLLAARGFGVLLFDWRAHGESGGELVSFGLHEQKDLTAAIDFATNMPGVDATRIGAIGFSRGGTVLAEVAAKDLRIRAVVFESTATGLNEGLCRDFGAGPFGCTPTKWMFSFYGIPVDAISAKDRICGLAPRPVLIIHGALDRSTPIEMGQRLAAAACAPKEFWEVADAGHGNFLSAEPEQYPKRLGDFFTASLL